MYAKILTKEYLLKLGITKVTEDGKHIYMGERELSQSTHKDGYRRVSLYDKDLFNKVYPETKCKNAGTIVIGVHRLVYAWFNEYINEGMVVDHINNIKNDNRVDNLQLLTPCKNLEKTRGVSTLQLKCNLNKPRSFYENKLNDYINKYEQAKINKEKNKCHILRTRVSQVRAMLRYFDTHINN